MSPPIMLAQDVRDRRRALAFVRRHVRQLYGGIPPPAQIFFYAEHRRRICGTIALDFAGRGEKFLLESIYGIDYDRTPWPFEREKIAQFSRWWTTRPGIGVHLMYAAHAYALGQGKRFGIVEVKPRIVARVEEFGMTLVKVAGAILQIKGESSRGERYYAIPPAPQLYMFALRANAAALARSISLQGGP